jgi:predicted RNA polymerase sigma factor
MCVNAATAIEAVYRASWGRTVAALIRLVGDFDLAEECAQEAGDKWRVRRNSNPDFCFEGTK